MSSPTPGDTPREEASVSSRDVIAFLEGLEAGMSALQVQINQFRYQIFVLISQQEYKEIADKEGENVIPPKDIVKIVMIERDGEVDVTGDKLNDVRTKLSGLPFRGLCPSWNAYSEWDGARRGRFMDTVFNRNREWFSCVEASLGEVIAWVKVNIKDGKISITASEYDAAGPDDIALAEEGRKEGKMPIMPIGPAPLIG